LVHRRFIGVGYDGGRNLKDEEWLMVTDTERPPADDRENLRKSSVVPRWVFTTALVIFASVVIVITYGYLARPGWVGVSGKKFWDYLELLIVPAALAIGVYMLNRAQERERQAQEAYREHEREATETARREREREAQAAQRERELEVENHRAQDATLQAYLDKMSELLLDKELHKKVGEYDPTRVAARARTLVALARLDRERKRSIVQFLYEGQLINTDEKPELGDATAFKPRLVGLSGAVLTNAPLGNLTLEYAALNGAILEKADLRDANLNNIDLGGAFLSGADLSNAKMKGASLENAHLQRKDELKLNAANVTDADLTMGNLKGAKVTKEQLAKCKLLKGATMPDGRTLKSDTTPEGLTFEDWFKSTGRGEDGENSGS
jgi:hypothetical protein